MKSGTAHGSALTKGRLPFIYRCPDCPYVVAGYSTDQGFLACHKCGSFMSEARAGSHQRPPRAEQRHLARRNSEAHLEGEMIAEELDRREADIGSLGRTPTFRSRKRGWTR